MVRGLLPVHLGLFYQIHVSTEQIAANCSLNLGSRQVLRCHGPRPGFMNDLALVFHRFALVVGELLQAVLLAHLANGRKVGTTRLHLTHWTGALGLMDATTASFH